MHIHYAEEPGGRFLGTGAKRAFRLAAMLFAMAPFSVQAGAPFTASPWTFPAIPDTPGIVGDEADRPDPPNIFDTIALPVRARPTSTRWTKITTAFLAQPVLVRLIEQARELPPKEQAEYVQTMVSHAIRNRPTAINCSDDGYWATASETLSHGAGDCIDIAVAKMEALRLLGIPKSDLYLTTGYVSQSATSGKGRETAALLVRIDDSFWLLPEQSEWIIEADGSTGDLSKFAPMITYGVGNTWVHGRLVKTAMLGN